MIVETDAIILQTLKYSETSIIAHIYTQAFGNGTYIMNNVRTNRSKMAFFQPLSLVHITAYRKKDTKQIHRLTSISFVQVPQSITGTFSKSSMALFIGEMVNRIFTEEEENPSFFAFFKSFVVLLENTTSNYANLHILFLLHLTKFMGVAPQDNFSVEKTMFSLLHAQFVDADTNNDCLSEKQSVLLHRILQTNEITDSIALTNSERQELLQILLRYYDVHICKTQNIKSLEILKMVFE